MTLQSILLSLIASTVAVATIDPARAGGLTLAHPYSIDSPTDAWVRAFSKCIEKTTGTYIRVIGGGKLGRSRDLTNAVADGRVDITVLPAVSLGERWPKLRGLAFPGLVYHPRDMLTLSQSPDFIGTLNKLVERDSNLVLLAVGWQHKVLVGRASGWENLLGKKLRVPTMAVAEAVRRAGARTVKIPTSELVPAMRYGAIDGAIVSADVIRDTIGRDALAVVQWSPDFAPFASPVVIVMNTKTAKVFDDLPSRIGFHCDHATRKFNERSFDEMEGLVERAGSVGARVGVSSKERTLWRGVFDDARAAVLGRRDPVVEAVRKALGR